MRSKCSCPPPSLSSSLTTSPCLPQPPGSLMVLQHTLCPSAWDALPHVASSLAGSLYTASVQLSLHPGELCCLPMLNITHIFPHSYHSLAPYFLHSAHCHPTHDTFIGDLVYLLYHNECPMMAGTGAHSSIPRVQPNV